MALPARHRFTVDAYHQMAAAGVLGPDDRVELLDGEVVQMNLIGSRHAACVTRLSELFTESLGRRAIVRVQNPIRLDHHSEPEPDLAVVHFRDDRYAGFHPGPADVLLLAEVAETSAIGDRRYKIPLYASAGISGSGSSTSRPK